MGSISSLHPTGGDLPVVNGLRLQTEKSHVGRYVLRRTSNKLWSSGLHCSRPSFPHSRRGAAQCVVSGERDAATDQETTKAVSLTGKIFGPEIPLTSTQSIAASIPTPARVATCAALVLGGLGAGYLAGGRVVNPPIAGQVAGAVVLGAAGAGAAHVLQKSSKEAAAKELHNALAATEDPLNIRKSDVVGIAEKYGSSLEDEPYRDELKDLYEKFVWTVVPPGNEPLRGNEADLISHFKGSLGLEDEDAAAVHIEIGRRIFRQRLETGDKTTALAERKAFQKLVYVSNLVFGDKSKFLLPWKRIFKVTDAQVDVAVRTNAQELFHAALEDSQAEADAEKLKGLRALQRKIKLPDELAGDMFQAAARKRLEGYVSDALGVLKARTRIKDMRRVLQQLDDMRAYHRALSAVSKAAAPGELVPGVGPITVLGEDMVEERSMEDLRALYKTYLSEALEKADRLDAEQVEALTDLRNIFGMGRREAEEAAEEVTRKAYRKKLAAAVTSGALDAAGSKADFLQRLCDDLHFDPAVAAQIHEDIYRQKLQQCLEDGALSDEDVAALLRLRVLLCVPKAVEEKAHADICGGIFAKVVDDAIGAGVDGYDADMREAVQRAVKGLRLPLDAAIQIASKAVRAIFLTYIRRARGSMSRTESARELKKMVIFSNLTVSQLVDDIKGEGGDRPNEGQGAAPEGEVAEAPEDDADMDFEDKIPAIQSLRKTRGKQREGKAQKEISVRDDLEVRERLDLYRTFLLFCLQGDTAGMPMGTALVVQRDESDFVRLAQLGDILGLSPAEAASVHQGLAEQAFTNQAQTLLADGQLSKARAEQLKEMQRQLGLPDAVAQRVVQQITSTKMAGAIDQAVQQGRLTVDDIRGLKEAGVDIRTMVAKKVREQMFTKLVAKDLEAGTGAFDSARILGTLPADLGIEPEDAQRMVREMARERLKGSLVQAVSLLRQKKPKESVSTLYNLLACDAAEPAPGALEWPVKEELWDLYSLFMAEPQASMDPTANGDAESAALAPSERLRQLLGIDESTARMLRDMVASGGFSLEGVNEEKFVF